MKRIITLIIFAAAALSLIPSCSELGGPATKEGAYLLKLDIACTDMQTKSDNGTDVEDLIKYVDYFFFADEAGTTPLGIHARVALPTEDGLGLTFDTSIPEYAALQNTSYVYVLANYPGTIDHESTNPTLAALLALPVDKPLYTAATETTPAQQPDCFVMDSYTPATETSAEKYTVQLKPAAVDEVRTQTIKLSRLAVKLSVQLNIEPSISTKNPITGQNETWTPLEEQMQIYYVNALNTTTLAGTPTQVLQQEGTRDGYFSYPTDYGFTGENHTYTTDPAYTYPQKWNAEDNGEPYFKLYLPWQGSIMGSSNFYYKIPVPQGAEKTLDRNSWYQVTLRVGVLGGTESDYVVIEDYEYCVADWSSPSWFSGSGLNSAKYFYVPGNEFHIYGDDHIDIPYYCNAAVNAYFTSISYWDYNATVEGQEGRSIERIMPFTGTENTSVTDYGGENNHNYTLSPDADQKVVHFTHDMTELYVLRIIKLTIVNSENSNQSKAVTIYQHPAIELKRKDAGDLFVNGHFARVKDARDASGQAFGESWTIDGETYNHSYRQRLYDRYWYDDTEYDALGWQGYYWDDYYWGGNVLQQGNRYVKSSEFGYITNAGTNGYGSIYGKIYGSTSTVSEDFFTTDITVTGFTDNNNKYTVVGEGEVAYKIGDPRVKASSVYGNFTLNPYLSEINNNGRELKTTQWNSANDIMICSPAENDRNIIAPRILISSGLTELLVRQIPSAFINFVKRGATFQEAGYPAGRWRLPTEGEVAFIAARQFDKTIPDIFNRDVPYYCASGRWVIVPSSGETLTFGTDINQEIEVWGSTYKISDLLDAKFVYDLWYWGDQPAWDNQPKAGQYVTNQYHPNGHTTSYKNPATN